MGFQLMRFIKAFQNKTDDYTGNIKCAKPLKDVLAFAKSYMGKGSKNTGKLYHGDFVVVKDRDWNTWYEIEKHVQDKTPTGTIKNVLETMLFRIQYYQGVATKVELQIRSTNAKLCFDEFEKDFAAIPDVVAPAAAPAPTVLPLGDLSDKTIAEVLDIFDKATKAFAENACKPTFDNVVAAKKALEEKVEALEIGKRAPFTQSIAKIDTFISAINMQLSNPAMASSAQNFAGTYASQIRAEIVQMASL